MEEQNGQTPKANAPKPINNKVLWFAFFVAIFVYNIVAILIAQMPSESRIKTFAPKLAGSDIETIVQSQDRFMGFIGMDGGTYSLVFSAFLIISIINFVVIFKLNPKAESKNAIFNSSGGPINYGLLRIAFAESMAIFGLMLFLINGNFSHLILFTALAIVGMLLVYPRE
ncbi:MAG: hypothetical protein WC788_00455 [Candidatus Paceibacterota bacterium]|jgi:hypothetical protein